MDSLVYASIKNNLITNDDIRYYKNDFDLLNTARKDYSSLNMDASDYNLINELNSVCKGSEG